MCRIGNFKEENAGNSGTQAYNKSMITNMGSFCQGLYFKWLLINAMFYVVNQRNRLEVSLTDGYEKIRTCVGTSVLTALGFNH